MMRQKNLFHTVRQNLLDENTSLVILSLVISGNLAFLLYKYFNLSQGYWSVVSIAAVMTADLSNTFSKMLARILGTVVGAMYAYLAVHFFADQQGMLILLLMVGVFVASIISLQKTAFSYAGIVANITIIIIIATSISAGNFLQIALNRTYEVCLGIIILGIVNLALYSHFKSITNPFTLNSLKALNFNFQDIQFRKNIIVTAIKVLLATALTLVPWFYFQYPGGFWATISCFFILEETLAKTQKKALRRFLAHLFAASFGLIAVLLIADRWWLLCIPLTLGFIVCGYILVHGKEFRNVGNTVGIALSVMLLADPGVQGSIEVILARFLNVIFGISVGILISSLPFYKINIQNK